MKIRPLVAAGLMLALSALGCRSPRGEEREEPRAAAPATASTSASTAAPTAAASTSRPRIVVLGDSLTAGLGLPASAAYPSLLQQRLKDAGMEFEVVNAGVSGDTSAGGLARLEWALEGDVRVLILALGANDGLRGLPVAQLERNLGEVIERAQARGIRVVLAGMEAPPNYGRDYIVAFHDVYPALAAKHGVPLVPFLLEGVAGSAVLNQRDGIHPTVDGARMVADTVWKVLQPIAEAQHASVTRGRPGS